MAISDFLSISKEVQKAIVDCKPIVALESTIISHGMPYPQNVATAIAVEQEVLKNGAVPATIAIMNGKCKVGLSSEELEYFGKEKNIWKVSLRDLPYVLTQGLVGATTVAATMRIADMAGIHFFATGGIGGVHRGAEKTMDISADLTEMAQTNVAVISAGVKSILDIGLTLEYLETLGVPVITFGQTKFPSFYSSTSDFDSPLTLASVSAIAKLAAAKWDIGLKGSVMIANPIDKQYEVEQSKIEKHIQDALASAESNQVTGKNVTPFILKHIADHTQGESLEANIALIKSNAKLAAQIAVAYSELKK